MPRLIELHQGPRAMAQVQPSNRQPRDRASEDRSRHIAARRTEFLQHVGLILDLSMGGTSNASDVMLDGGSLPFVTVSSGVLLVVFELKDQVHQLKVERKCNLLP